MTDVPAPRQRFAPWFPRKLTLDSSRVIVLFAIAFGFIIGTPFLLGAITSDVPAGVVVLFYVCGTILGGLLGSTIDSGRTLVGRGKTRLSFQQVRDLAIETFGREGWTYGGETRDAVWYSRRVSANYALFAVLLVLGAIPGLIYLAAARRTQRAEVTWKARNGATYVEITISPKGDGGQRLAAEFAGKLA
ncbi:hypothetical protein BH09CHL1_BH09CHL1_30490 [soil metagenome]